MVTAGGDRGPSSSGVKGSVQSLPVPPALQDQLDEIVKLVDDIARGLHDDRATLPEQADDDALQRATLTLFKELAPPEKPLTIGILGDRGSGKTTILRFVCFQLVTERHDLVLPIVRPELFAERDSLTGWILATLRKTIESLPDQNRNALQPVTVEGDEYRLGEWLQQVREQEALVQRGYSEALPHQNLSLGEFARDASLLSSQGRTFMRNWGKLVDALLDTIFGKGQAEKSARRPLMVIPIDDADLTPHVLPGIFMELRRLAHRQVVFLFCARESAVTEALTAHYLWGRNQQYPVGLLFDRGLIGEDDVREEAHRQFVKALPVDLRVRRSPLTPAERIDFRPIDMDRALITMLDQVEIKGVPHLGKLGDLFVFHGRVSDDLRVTVGDPTTVRPARLPVPSPYAKCLSDVPRDLTQFYSLLRRLVDRDPASPQPPPDHAARIARQLIDHAIGWSQARVPREHHEALRWSDVTDRFTIELDFTGIEFDRLIGPEHVIRRTRIDTADVVNVVRPFTALTAKSTISGTASRSSRSASDGELGLRGVQEERSGWRGSLPPAFTNVLLLADELSRQGSELNSAGRFGAIGRPGGSSWRGFLEVQVDGSETDGLFWPVPDWDDRYDYFLYAEGWNRMVEAVRQVPTDPIQLRRDTLLDWFLLGHLRLVCSVQGSRQIPADLWEVSPDDLSSILQDTSASILYRRESQQQIQKAFELLYRESMGPGRTARHRQFRGWFDTQLPWAADMLASSRQLSTWIKRTRERVIRTPTDLSQANKDAAEALAVRVRRHITQPWVTSTIKLLEDLDAGTSAEVGAQREREQVRRSPEFAEVIQQMVGRGVPRDVILLVRNFGFTPDLVQELQRDFGYEAEELRDLVARFSSTSLLPDAPSDDVLGSRNPPGYPR